MRKQATVRAGDLSGPDFYHVLIQARAPAHPPSVHARTGGRGGQGSCCLVEHSPFPCRIGVPTPYASTLIYSQRIGYVPQSPTLTYSQRFPYAPH